MTYDGEFVDLFVEMCVHLVCCDGAVRDVEIERAVELMRSDIEAAPETIDALRYRLRQPGASADVERLECLNLYGDAAREMVLRAAIDIAAADGDFCESEQTAVIELGFLIGCEPVWLSKEIRSRMEQLEDDARQLERAYVTLGERPESSHEELQASYDRFRSRYSVTTLEALGPQFVAAGQQRLVAVETAWSRIQSHRQRAAFFAGEERPLPPESVEDEPFTADAALPVIAAPSEQPGVVESERVSIPQWQPQPSAAQAGDQDAPSLLFSDRPIDFSYLSALADTARIADGWDLKDRKDLELALQFRPKGMSQKFVDSLRGQIEADQEQRALVEGAYVPWTAEWAAVCRRLQSLMELLDSGEFRTMRDLGRLRAYPPPRFRDSHRQTLDTFIRVLSEAAGSVWVEESEEHFPSSTVPTVAWRANHFEEDVCSFASSLMRDREWLIISSRFGLQGQPVRTLEELGTELGLTRERVRQVESKGLGRFRTGLAATQQPLVGELLKPFYTQTVGGAWVFPVERYWQLLEQEVQLSRESSHRTVNFLLWCNNIFVFESNMRMKDALYFHGWQGKELTRLEGLVRAQFSDRGSEQRTEQELFSALDGELKEKVTPEQVGVFLANCTSVETDADGRWSTAFSELNRREQLYVILQELGTPTHFEQLYDLLRGRVEPGSEPGTRTVSNYMVGDSRFTCIGRSGLWGLTEWGVEDRTIVEVMVAVLREAGTPLSSQQISERVVSRRHASQKSIDAYLSMESERFYRCGLDEWGLKEWEDDPDYRERFDQQMRALIVEFSGGDPTRTFQLAELQQFVTRRTGMPKRSARAVLNWSPYLDVWREGWNRAECRYRTEPSEQRRERQRRVPTQQQVFDDFLTEDLFRDDNVRELPLKGVVDAVERELGILSATTYSLVRKCEFLDTLDKDGSKWCRYVPEGGQVAAPVPAASSTWLT